MVGRFCRGERLILSTVLHVRVSASIVQSGGVVCDGCVFAGGWFGERTPERNGADAPDGQFIAIAAGAVHSCGIRTDNTVACWGPNWWGEATPPDGQFTAIATGVGHACGIHTNRLVTCWGHNSSGQTNPPKATFRTEPWKADGDHWYSLIVDGAPLLCGTTEIMAVAGYEPPHSVPRTFAPSPRVVSVRCCRVGK